MDGNNETDSSQLFLVRLWFDDGDAQGEGARGERACHGKVQHVITGKAVGFDTWPALNSVLLEMMQPDRGNSGKLQQEKGAKL